MPLLACSQALSLNPAFPALAAPPSETLGRPRRSSLGLVTYALLIHQRAASQLADLPNIADPITFLKQAIQLGASGMQVPLGIRDPAYAKQLRELAADNDFYLESTSVLPKTDSDLDRFEKELQTARDCGVSIIRTVIIPGRRYEQFKTYAEFAAAAEQGKGMLQRAEPLARRYKIRLAVENHKDQRAEERLKLLEFFSSEHIGVTLDVGNSLALLEDPIATAEAFAPWTLTVHFKDQGVAEYEEGFLLADVPLGLGCIDLSAILAILKRRCPKARLGLELITRDPLKVPVLSNTYWHTLSSVSASELGRMLNVLKHTTHPGPFETISNLPLAAQVQAEQRNITESLKFAVKQLGLAA